MRVARALPKPAFTNAAILIGSVHQRQVTATTTILPQIIQQQTPRPQQILQHLRHLLGCLEGPSVASSLEAYSDWSSSLSLSAPALGRGIETLICNIHRIFRIWPNRQLRQLHQSRWLSGSLHGHLLPQSSQQIYSRSPTKALCRTTSLNPITDIYQNSSFTQDVSDWGTARHDPFLDSR